MNSTAKTSHHSYTRRTATAALLELSEQKDAHVKSNRARLANDVRSGACAADLMRDAEIIGALDAEIAFYDITSDLLSEGASVPILIRDLVDRAITCDTSPGVRQGSLAAAKKVLDILNSIEN